MWHFNAPSNHLHIGHKNTAAATAAIAPNFASKNACAVGLASPVDVAVVRPAEITLLTILNWSSTCRSLNALAPLGSAVYQFGREKNVVVVSATVTSAGME